MYVYAKIYLTDKQLRNNNEEDLFSTSRCSCTVLCIPGVTGFIVVNPASAQVGSFMYSCGKKCVPHDSVVCRPFLTSNSMNDIIHVLHCCGRVLAHLSLQHCVTSFRFVRISLCIACLRFFMLWSYWCPCPIAWLNFRHALLIGVTALHLTLWWGISSPCLTVCMRCLRWYTE